jgi:hypothetical protein
VALKKRYNITSVFLLLCLTVISKLLSAQNAAGYIAVYAYDSCVQLKNKIATVILEPNAGGRVISYSLNGINVLYEDSLQNGWVSSTKMPHSKGHLAGGRFDIGPSRTKPNTDLFFFGKWNASITGRLSARLTSQTDPITKIYLIRDFVLDSNTSHLSVTQTIVNTGSKSFKACFWGRTFVAGNGICLMPVNSKSRFPKKYMMFMNRDTINMFPSDTNIFVKDDLLVIKGPPQKPKLEMDVDTPGWIAYATTSNYLFVKKFKIYNDRQYGDVSAANASVWYNGTQMTEIEPIGPWELIRPGNRKSFSEHWYLSEYKFPVTRIIDTERFKKLVKQLTK